MLVERTHAATPIRWRVVVLAAFFFLATAPSQAGFPDLFADDPLATAVRKGSLADSTAALLAGSSANAQAADGTPVIVLAVAVSSLDIVKILIENDARPDKKSKDQTTALTLAAANGEVEIAHYLLDHKADVNEPGSLRETALIKATRAHHNAVVKLLVERGADLDETDTSGATSLEIAQRSGWGDTVVLLMKKKAGSK